MNLKQRYYKGPRVIKASMINKDEVKNATEAVLWHLQTRGSITSWQAIREYGATRLSSIIYNLRRKGYIIESTPKKVRTQFGYTTTVAKYIYTQLPVNNF